MSDLNFKQTLGDARAGRWASYPVGPPYIQHVEYLESELATIRAKLEYADHVREMELKLKQEAILTLEECARQHAATRAEAVRLRVALLESIRILHTAMGGNAFMARDSYNALLMKAEDILSSTPSTQRESDRVQAMERVVEEWPKVWVAFQQAEADSNLGVQVEARRRLNELAQDALAAYEQVVKK